MAGGSRTGTAKDSHTRSSLIKITVIAIANATTGSVVVVSCIIHAHAFSPRGLRWPLLLMLLLCWITRHRRGQWRCSTVFLFLIAFIFQLPNRVLPWMILFRGGQGRNILASIVVIRRDAGNRRIRLGRIKIGCHCGTVSQWQMLLGTSFPAFLTPPFRSCCLSDTM